MPNESEIKKMFNTVQRQSSDFQCQNLFEIKNKLTRKKKFEYLVFVHICVVSFLVVIVWSVNKYSFGTEPIRRRSLCTATKINGVSLWKAHVGYLKDLLVVSV